MPNVFENYEKTLYMVKGAYKKLKSHIFYDRTLLHVKKRIALFESNRVDFEKTLQQIAKALSEKDNSYFDAFIEKIDYKILPKKFISSQINEEVIFATADQNQHIHKVNFFIDMPIELYIVDFIWTLFVGKIMSSYKQQDYRFVAATVFKRGLYCKDPSLTDGIEFSSNRTFVPYFHLYSSWRDKAFQTIEQKNKAEDLMLLCLDLKSFYYSVEFNFDYLKDYLHNDERLESFDFLTQIIRKIYFKYRDKISWVKRDLKQCKKGTCIFPIGVTSSFVLREIYMAGFDNNLYENLCPYYYKRYVDDMLIVMKAEENVFDSTIEKKHLIQKYLIQSKGKLDKDGDLVFEGYENIHIQQEKINCFCFPKNKKAIILDIYREIIGNNSSEANLLPNEDILKVSFTNSAYSIKNIDISSKLRDLGLLVNNNYQATHYLNSFSRLIKNTIPNHNEMENFFDQVEEFYSGSKSIEYSNSWSKLFELYLLCNEQDRGRRFYSSIKQQINKITLEYISDDEHLQRPSQVLKRIKSSLMDKLDIAISLAGAADFHILKQKRHSELAIALRTSNMFNHNLVAYPLLNYSQNNTMSLTEVNLQKIRKEEHALQYDFCKFEWSPRYIKSYEFYIANFLYDPTVKKASVDPNVIFNRYIQYNSLSSTKRTNIPVQEKSVDEKITMFSASIDKLKYDKHKIAIVNTKIIEQQVLGYLENPQAALSLEAKLNLYKCMNSALEGGAEFLIFPEFYLPIAWLVDVASFALEHDLTVITGLQYIINGKTVNNNVCTIIPNRMGSYFKHGILQFREKNFYAPKERLSLSQMGYSCKDAVKPFYYIYEVNNFRFANILCYEFTDIRSRASLKSNIELLFVPQLNQDTNYFSAIVDSAARDLHSFVVQANTSVYGDSRITAPYDTLHKNIVLVKGGETDVVMIGEVRIEELRTYRGQYNASMNRKINRCLNCKKMSTRTRQNINKHCQNCENNKIQENQIIKGLPPMF